MVIRLAGIAGTFSLSLGIFCITQSTLSSFSRIRTMTSHPNRSSTFYYYLPGSRKYHIHYTPPTIPLPPTQVGTRPHPPPQGRAGHSSSDGHVKSYRPIKPAPTTTSTRDSTSLPAKKSSSPRKSSSGRKEYRFIPYSPR